MALGHNNIKMATILLDHGSSLVHPATEGSETEGPSEELRSLPLLTAVSACSTETVSMLIDRGAVINAVSGSAALKRAILQQNESMIKLVLSHSAKIDPSCIHKSLSGPVSLTRFLLESANDDLILHSALQGAAEVGRVDMVKLLLEDGAKPDVLDFHSDSPLVRADKKRLFRDCRNATGSQGRRQ